MSNKKAPSKATPEKLTKDGENTPYKEYMSVREGRTTLSYVPLKIEDSNVYEGSKLVDHSFVVKRMSNLLGRMLTIIDASISDKQQNKAIKDIIKGEFVDEYGNLADIMYNQELMCALANDSIEDSNPDDIEQVAIEDIG